MTTRIDTQCPHCGTRHTASTSPEDESAVPKSNDATMCIACGRFSIFDDKLQLRIPTHEEMSALGTNHDLLRLHSAWVEAVHNRKKPS
jgi:hypothetical protein